MVQDPNLGSPARTFLITSRVHQNFLSFPAQKILFKTDCLRLFAVKIEWKFIGMFFADSQLSMGVVLKIANPSTQTNPLTANVDGSVYTLPQLLKARRWFDADQGRWL